MDSREQFTKKLYDTDRPNIIFMGDVRLQRGTQLVGKYIRANLHTKDNLVLWKDLEEGIVREPNKKIVYKENYARSGLTGYIPIAMATLEVPHLIVLYARQVDPNIRKSRFYIWRPSLLSQHGEEVRLSVCFIESVYPTPTKVIGVGWDTFRTSRNSAKSNCIFQWLVHSKKKKKKFNFSQVL